MKISNMSEAIEVIKEVKKIIPEYETLNPRTWESVTLWAVQAAITVGLILIVLWFLFKVIKLKVSLGG